ncbi:MAG: hypothetical protein M5U12_07075 [Verrucomicrobia bacterium]|nr:hypothetical protein [Verrucomicrobiota bacterium]
MLDVDAAGFASVGCEEHQSRGRDGGWVVAVEVTEAGEGDGGAEVELDERVGAAAGGGVFGARVVVEQMRRLVVAAGVLFGRSDDLRSGDGDEAKIGGLGVGRGGRAGGGRAAAW